MEMQDTRGNGGQICKRSRSICQRQNRIEYKRMPNLLRSPIHRLILPVSPSPTPPAATRLRHPRKIIAKENSGKASKQATKDLVPTSSRHASPIQTTRTSTRPHPRHLPLLPRAPRPPHAHVRHFLRHLHLPRPLPRHLPHFLHRYHLRLLSSSPHLPSRRSSLAAWSYIQALWSP
jgi:hypothetical protein